MLGYFCTFDISDQYYSIEVYDFVLDRTNDGTGEIPTQGTIDEFGGLDNYGQIEGGYSLEDDLAGIRGDLEETFICECGREEFYVRATRRGVGGYDRMYSCTNPDCDAVFIQDDIASGMVVNVMSTTYME